MMQWDRMVLGRTAKEMGVVRDTLEKVYRLVDVLKFMEEDGLLSKSIALKGGTAINLTIFDLPRLSVDIDLDYCKSIEREEMLADRKAITNRISKYMMANGYILSQKSKSYHALDSFVYEYINSGGVRDNLKIEINYMLRSHVLPVVRREVKLLWDQSEIVVLSVAPLEIFASKIVALLTRTAPRDLFDIHNMVKYGLFDESEEDMLRKCTVFYSAIGAEQPPVEFELEVVQKEVRDYLAAIMIPTEDEKMFWQFFSQKKYCPERIFGESRELQNISNHPMALWKCRDKEGVKT